MKKVRVHQITLRGDQLHYHVNGAHVDNVELPAPVAAAPSQPLLVFGSAADASGNFLWTFEGAVFLVLVHTEMLSRDSLQQLAAACLADEGAWGASRPGDGTVDGAQLHTSSGDAHPASTFGALL